MILIAMAIAEGHGGNHRAAGVRYPVEKIRQIWDASPACKAGVSFVLY